MRYRCRPGQWKFPGAPFGGLRAELLVLANESTPFAISPRLSPLCRVSTMDALRVLLPCLPALKRIVASVSLDLRYGSSTVEQGAASEGVLLFLSLRLFSPAFSLHISSGVRGQGRAGPGPGGTSGLCTYQLVRQAAFSGFIVLFLSAAVCEAGVHHIFRHTLLSLVFQPLAPTLAVPLALSLALGASSLPGTWETRGSTTGPRSSSVTTPVKVKATPEGHGGRKRMEGKANLLPIYLPSPHLSG
ncbi:uncharacterized protein LY79DRAFT_93816 [Colletotrichum navitas]|uniref:Uncharacterized protein n=1 Tax=Colletotrichum navitas TaxID=681940 RepID=A0AAD8Q755_9PEZI|nr:uncharacterized protein LY79DRAFT_93816 [Colletotrichum navitas]KAK1595829.1 hypothetical protein LY79DRAFT_93816 [Colletotrichum navitas]